MGEFNNKIEKYKIISAIRGIDPNYIIPLAQALYDGGIRLIEITFNQDSETVLDDTYNSITAIKKEFGDALFVGAGTVLSCEQVNVAKNAGAEFILSAVTDIEVIRYGKELGLGVIPGALSPSEILVGYNNGADYIKVFPASVMGISYIKSIRAPLSHVPMIAMGGVNEKNIMDFLNSGMVGVGIGSNLANKALVENGNFDEITRLARLYTVQLSL